MKLFTKAAAAAFAVVMLAGQVDAIPFASKISVSDTTINAGSGATISYLLNETAEDVLVELVDGNTVVASFAGTTSQGVNQVVWNGTIDNATGAVIPAGTYRVRITADKTTTAWAEVASQRSLGNWGPETIFNQIFNGYSPNDYLYVTDTDNDSFGTGIGFSMYSSPKHAAGIIFNADLSTYNGTDGLEDRVFKAVEVEAKDTVANSDMWGATVDPVDPNIIYQTGQSGLAGYAFLKGDVNSSETLASADPTNILAGILPRSVAVQVEGDQKYAYFTYGNSTIAKVAMNPTTNELTGPLNVITSGFADATRYGRFVTFDDAGNLYWVSRQLGTTGVDGIVLRWDAATIAGATPSLTEANASWSITPPADTTNLGLLAITPSGDVYLMATGGTARGVYFIGNSDTATLTKALALSDRVISFDAVGTNNASLTPSTIYSGVRSDPAGNLLVFDRSNEQNHLFAPPADSSVAITAPTSQTITVEGSHVQDWSMY